MSTIIVQRRRRLVVGCIAAALILASAAPLASRSDARPRTRPVKPTIVLVHGAWADGSSWDGVTRRLQHDGYTVVVPAVPLRSLSGDAAYVASVLNSIKGPIVVVGHS